MPYTGLETYQVLAKAFNAGRTGVQVVVQLPFFEGRIDQILLAQESDCFAFPGDVDVTLNERVFLDLEPYMSADPDFPLDDYYPFLLDTCRRQGEVWCLPFDARFKMLYYNRRLFDQAGLPYPTLTWSMTDFLETAKALTTGQEKEKQFGFVSFAGESRDLLSFIVRDGALLFDTSDVTGTVRPSFDGPPVVAALRRYASLRTTDEAMPPLIPDRTKLEGEKYMSLKLEPEG